MDATNMKVELELKQTLVELTDDHAIVEQVVTTSVGGQAHAGEPRRATIQAKSDKTDWKEVGNEDVKAVDKTFACKVIEGTRSVLMRGGQMAEDKGKFWVSSDVPGGVVQMKLNSKGPGGQARDMTYLLKSFEAK
jgi:hypothetical protein